MLFASRVAENGNRVSRLIFQAPLYVPAPTTKHCDGDGTVHNLRNMPSWMTNRDDPFGPDVAILPLRVPSNDSVSGSLVSFPSPSDTAPPMSAGSTVSDASARTRPTDAKQGQPRNNGSERKVITERCVASADAHTIAQRDTAQESSKPPLLPLHATLLPGGTSMPMLSTLANGVLVNHIPNGPTGAVMVSVVLPKGEETNTQSTPVQLQVAPCKSDALSEISIPNTPFDPFGPSGNARSGINPYFPTVSTIERQQGAALDVAPSVNDAQSETEGYCYDSKKEPKRQYVGPRINDRAKVDRKDTGFGVGALPTTPSLKDRLWGFRRRRGAAGNQTVHSSFIDLPRQPGTIPDRETQSEHARTSIITGTGASSTISNGSADSEDVNNTSRLTEATQPAQAEQAPCVPEKDSCAPGTVTESAEKQERRGGKGLGKSMMDKIRKLGHSKKYPSD